MIIDVVGVPNVSLLDARLLCESVGVRLGYLRAKVPHFVSFKPQVQSYFGPLRVVYIDDPLVFNQYADGLYHKKQHHVILLNAAASTLREVGVQLHGDDGEAPFLPVDLLRFFGSKPQHGHDTILTIKDNLAEKIMQSINKESLLGKLQTAFYRIRQVEDRHSVQNIVFSYLSGNIKRRPPIKEFPFIEKLMVSDICTRFVSAVIFAKKFGPDRAAQEFGIDRFEIAYVLTRGGYDVEEH